MVKKPKIYIYLRTGTELPWNSNMPIPVQGQKISKGETLYVVTSVLYALDQNEIIIYV